LKEERVIRLLIIILNHRAQDGAGLKSHAYFYIPQKMKMECYLLLFKALVYKLGTA